ncbi:MAG: hypothetical protein HY320_14680 [Armatimonadetes bacterium]|nr:hypothetical protein [Armatimonadota bacterium]
MLPTIREGDVVTCEPIHSGTIRRGDIILHRFRHGVIAHRVVKIEARRGQPAIFILRGDACAADDAPVDAAQILGRVVAVERNGRVISLAGPGARLARAFRVEVSRWKAWLKAAYRW